MLCVGSTPILRSECLFLKADKKVITRSWLFMITRPFSCPKHQTCYTVRDIVCHVCMNNQKELEQLEKKRDLLAFRVVKLMIHIALIFAIPAAIAIAIHYFFDIRFRFLFPVAFILSWILVIRLYRKTDRQMRELDQRIMKLKRDIKD